jgi:hypothetical protein
MLAYGVVGDLVDEYLRMSETTFLDSMYNFCKAVIVMFVTFYLRDPNAKDTVYLLSSMRQGGFWGRLEVLIACIGVKELSVCMAGTI